MFASSLKTGYSHKQATAANRLQPQTGYSHKQATATWKKVLNRSKEKDSDFTKFKLLKTLATACSRTTNANIANSGPRLCGIFFFRIFLMPYLATCAPF